jgi:hypothetical protein
MSPGCDWVEVPIPISLSYFFSDAEQRKVRLQYCVNKEDPRILRDPNGDRLYDAWMLHVGRVFRYNKRVRLNEDGPENPSKESDGLQP